MEALIEIFGSLFEILFEFRKERAEKGDGAQETVLLGGQQDGQPGGQPDGGPYSYQLGGRPQPQDGQQAASQGTSSRRGIRQ